MSAWERVSLNFTNISVSLFSFMKQCLLTGKDKLEFLLHNSGLLR